MIDLGSIGGLHARQHELHAYCPRCDRCAVLPLARQREAQPHAATAYAVPSVILVCRPVPAYLAGALPLEEFIRGLES